MKIIIVSILALTFTSCATVRVVKSKPGRGGVISLTEGLFGEPASEMADKTMNRNCKRGYKVMEEGEVVVGSTSRTSGRENTKGSMLASNSEKSLSSETSTKDETEWRITYKCKR